MLAAGCHDNNNGNGAHDMAMNGGGGDDGGDNTGADMTDRGDMTDTTVTPAPTTMHVGGTGPTAGLVTAGVTAAAYVLNQNATTGELHVVTADGTDKTVDTAVPIGNYQLTSDGKQIIYAKTGGSAGALLWADVSGAAVTKKTLFATTYASPVLSQGGFMSPSGHFFLAGVKATGVANSLDMHVIRMTDGADVFDRLNGGFDYLEIVLPDDTCIYPGHRDGNRYEHGHAARADVVLDGAPDDRDDDDGDRHQYAYGVVHAVGGQQAARLSEDERRPLLVGRERQDGHGHQDRLAAAKFTVGDGAVALHRGRRLGARGLGRRRHEDARHGCFRGHVAVRADRARVGQCRRLLLPERRSHTGGVQNNTGTLMRVAVKASATASKVADKMSIVDLQVFDNAIVFLQNLGVPPIAPAAQYGDVAMAKRDGTGIIALGTKSPVGGLQAVDRGSGRVVGDVPDHRRRRRQLADRRIAGRCSARSPYADYTGATAITLDANVHDGMFGFALDDPRTAAFVTGRDVQRHRAHYVGALAFLATRQPSMKIDGMVTGVSELGPIVNRSLFVNAPTAATAGVYVTY